MRETSERYQARVCAVKWLFIPVSLQSSARARSTLSTITSPKLGLSDRCWGPTGQQYMHTFIYNIYPKNPYYNNNVISNTSIHISLTPHHTPPFSPAAYILLFHSPLHSYTETGHMYNISREKQVACFYYVYDNDNNTTTTTHHIIYQNLVLVWVEPSWNISNGGKGDSSHSTTLNS